MTDPIMYLAALVGAVALWVLYDRQKREEEREEREHQRALQREVRRHDGDT